MRFRRRRDDGGESAPAVDETGLAARSEGAGEDQPGSDTVFVDGTPLRVHPFGEDHRKPVDGVERLLARLNEVAAAAGSERRWRIAYLADAFGDAAFTSESVAATAPWADQWELPGG